MANLSTAMIEHLLVLAKEPADRGAYPGLSLGTLYALERRGLVRCAMPIGSTAFPQNAIRWTITKAGRDAAA